MLRFSRGTHYIGTPAIFIASGRNDQNREQTMDKQKSSIEGSIYKNK